MLSPYSRMPRWLPERKPSPNPTSRSNEPTPQAIPNMVRNERSLCAQSVRRIWSTISRKVRKGGPVDTGFYNAGRAVGRREITCHISGLRFRSPGAPSGDQLVKPQPARRQSPKVRDRHLIPCELKTHCFPSFGASGSRTTRKTCVCSEFVTKSTTPLFLPSPLLSSLPHPADAKLCAPAQVSGEYNRVTTSRCFSILFLPAS